MFWVHFLILSLIFLNSGFASNPTRPKCKQVVSGQPPDQIPQLVRRAKIEGARVRAVAGLDLNTSRGVGTLILLNHLLDQLLEANRGFKFSTFFAASEFLDNESEISQRLAEYLRARNLPFVYVRGGYSNNGSKIVSSDGAITDFPANLNLPRGTILNSLSNEFGNSEFLTYLDKAILEHALPITKPFDDVDGEEYERPYTTIIFDLKHVIVRKSGETLTIPDPSFLKDLTKYVERLNTTHLVRVVVVGELQVERRSYQLVLDNANGLGSMSRVEARQFVNWTFPEQQLNLFLALDSSL